MTPNSARDNTIAPETLDMVTNWLIAAIAAHGGTAKDLRVRLTTPAGPAAVTGQANLTHIGRPLRVQVLGPDAEEAGLLLSERLTRRLGESVETFTPRPWQTSRGHALDADTQPQLTRRKGVQVETLRAAEAARTMDELDYDAHLFREVETGHDAVIYRTGPTGYRLVRQHPAAPPEAPLVPLVTEPRPAPTLAVPDALALLHHVGARAQFFTDQETGRGTLLYRRYAGGYGQIKTT